MKFVSAITALLAISTLPMLKAQQWTPATPEELRMTSVSAVPGADAVILNHEEIDDDDNHVQHHYYRIKVLTEKGLSYADVDINWTKNSDMSGVHVGEFFGRTVQPDGSIVPYTGKGMDKVLEKGKDGALERRVYALPAAKVGSILEYSYSLRMDDHWFRSPRWYVQDVDLYTKNAKFLWKPTDKDLLARTRGGREQVSQRIAWADSLPSGVKVSNLRLPTGRMNFSVAVSDVMPFSREQYMPPIYSSRYHVFFYYTPYYDTKDFWANEVKFWANDTAKFESASGDVATLAHEVTKGATSDEEKARKLYAFVMTLENTDYTRARTMQEEKNEVKNAADVLARKHGTANQIAMTYVALARAAGLKASSMYVSDRSNLILDVNWQDMSQLTDVIAIVNYGGAEHYLDPGSRHMPFGHLEWDHTITGGARQDARDFKDMKAMFAITPGEPYKFSRTSRVGDLKLSDDGTMSGKLTFTFEGSPALRWRHVALRNDESELKDQLRKDLEALLPAGSEVTVTSIQNVTNGELPLKVDAKVSGHVGNAVGSRVMLPSVLFEGNSGPRFPHERRDLAVYFPYSEMVQDAVRYTLPAGWTVESAPNQEVAKYKNIAAHSITSQQTPNTITVRRDFIIGEIYFPHEEYGELRTFYSEFEAKDHSNVILKRNATTAGLTGSATTN